MLISVLFVIRNNIHSSFCDLRFGCTLLLVQKWIPSIANFWHFVIRNNFHRSFCYLKFGITLLLVPKWMPSSSNFCLYGTRNNIHSSPAVIAVCKHTPVCSRWITLHFCAFSTMTIISLALESFLISMLSFPGQNFITTYYLKNLVILVLLLFSLFQLFLLVQTVLFVS